MACPACGARLRVLDSLRRENVTLQILVCRRCARAWRSESRATIIETQKRYLVERGRRDKIQLGG
jgi:hypothetical protein